MHKPLDALANISSVLQSCELKVLEEGDQIELKQGDEFFIVELISGIGSFVDSTAPDGTMAFVNAPHIIGLGLAINDGPQPFSLALKAQGTCVYRIMSWKVFSQLSIEHNLGQSQCDILAYQLFGMTRLFLASTRRRNMYTVISLLHILILPESEFIRLRFHMCDYIQGRCSISRSTIMQILSVLIKKRYIESYRGKLISVNINPDEFPE